MRIPRPASVAIAAMVVAASALVGASSAQAAAPFSFAVIGDVPYGSAQTAAFPSLIQQINADPNVQLVSHLGDISSPLNCSTSYYQTVKGQFDSFLDPMVYTPGDNEWTDCSRAAVGAGDPLQHLATLRTVFFPSPGTSLGASPIPVTANQTDYPENVMFDESGVTFGLFHAVGSWNDLATWSGNSGITTAQRAEVTARIDAAVSLIRDTFARASAAGSRAVVFITQADMFISSQGSTYKSGFQAIVQALASESLAFGKPVLLVNGDTHSYRSDKPLTSSTLRSFYGVPSNVPNLSRVTIQGGTSEWTRFTVVDTSAVLQWQRIPFAAAPPPPPPNVPPTAAFSASPSGLTAVLDASGSHDSDGSISGYAWDFGDGTTGTGTPATHVYGKDGVYNVTLTVTDDHGATGVLSQPVSVAADVTPPPPPPPPPPGPLAQDSFTRTASGAWGTADTGGPWTLSGSSSAFSVNGSAGAVGTPAGGTRYSYLTGVSSTSTDLTFTASAPRPTSGTLYLGAVGRRVGSAYYLVRALVSSSGSVQLQARQTSTTLRSATVSGLTFASGDRLQFRIQVTGTNPTTMQAKVWKAGAPEPAAWQVSTVDSSSGLQAPGYIGVYDYFSSGASPASLPVIFDDFLAVPVG